MKFLFHQDELCVCLLLFVGFVCYFDQCLVKLKNRWLRFVCMAVRLMVRFDVLESMVWKKFLFCNSSVYELSTYEFRVFVCGYIQDVF